MTTPMTMPISSYINLIWPWMLLTLLLVPLAVWGYWRREQRRLHSSTRLGPLHVSANRAGSGLGFRRHIPPILFLLALVILLISLARPEAMLSLPRMQGTVILAFDVSNSMIADDLEPTRLEAAKTAAVAFAENQPIGIDIGIVAFGNGGLIVQQPTRDRTAILSAVQRISPQGGTSLGQGIFTSLNAIAGERIALDESAIDSDGRVDLSGIELERFPSSVILLLTDGENTDSIDPMVMAQLAAESGVRIYPVGLGSPEGTTIEVDGFNLVTVLDEQTLQEIANISNGTYLNAANSSELVEVYETVDLRLAIDPEMTEITALLAGLGALFLIVGLTLAMLWYGRAP